MSIIIIIATALAIVDTVWFCLTFKMYSEMVEKIQKSEYKPRFIASALSHFILFIGMLYFVFPALRHHHGGGTTTHQAVMAHGFVYGLVTHGMLNATNCAMFTRYSVVVAFIDTIWGGVVCFLVAGFFVAVHNIK